MKCSEFLLANKETVRKILALAEEVKPLIGNAKETADPEKRAKVYALATLAVQLLPWAIIELAPLDQFKKDGKE